MTKVVHKDGMFVVEGNIDEFVDYKVFDGAARPLKLDLSKVKNCNSVGVREFLKFVRKEAPLGLEFHRCSTAIMDMINSIPSSLGVPSKPEIVKSMVLSYRCHGCAKDESFLLEAKTSKGGVPSLPTLACHRCKANMAPAIEAEDLFTYLVAND